ncbi:response regulator MprA [Muribaculaceae bacterium]|nr:DNA-binding response regulator [Muribaculaceae bacterium Isolate-036 (Harlan)]GFI38413.1 response regulator MprA [Muribaculaceae bacterium]
MSNKILFVEDEEDLTLIVADTLHGQGYEVITAVDGVDGLEKFKTKAADIVVADVMMPKMDGFTMAKEIRKLSPTVPLLFLTAKSTIDDVEQGFEIGANDYLKKPFELRELIVRIKALLRRYGDNRTEDMQFAIGLYTFNVTTQTLSFGDKETELSHFEAKILERLAINIGRTVNASELMIAVWQRDEPSNRNSLHGYIHKLRRALRYDPSISIINQRGFGYMLVIRN